MNKSRLALLAPIASVMILVLGSGFYTTFTSVHLQKYDIANWLVGCVSSAYFSGLVISAFRSQHFIFRVGHIRAFSAFAALIAVTTLVQGLFFSPTLWIVIRFISGYSLAGICVVIESWLMAASTHENRGTILSVYMVAYYLAQATGQLFIKIPFAYELMGYCMIAICAALSVLPVTMTRFSAPSPENPSILSFRYLYQKAPLGVISCIISGLILGPLYTLVPVYLQENAKPDDEVGWVMLAMILGGTLLQYPIGKMSDKIDRRKVMVGMSFFCVITFVLFIPDIYNIPWLMALGFAIGAGSFIIYPLATSHTIDHVSNNEMVSAISTLLLAYGIGSTLGPLLPSMMMDWMGPNGLCYYLLVVSIILFLYSLITVITKPEKAHEQSNFMSLPRTTPNAMPNPQQVD